jgi:hypothetical protein
MQRRTTTKKNLNWNDALINTHNILPVKLLPVIYQVKKKTKKTISQGEWG